MGMILRIASSRIVGQGDIVGRSGYFSLNLSANSVMRGRLDARRTLKSLVADLRDNTKGSWGFKNLTIFRYAEVLLMYAEACVQTDDADGLGLQCLQDVQNRAGSDYVSTQLTLEDVKKEKSFEMWLEGVRFPDMVRWGDTDGVKDNGKNIPTAYDAFFTKGEPKHRIYVEYSNPNSGTTGFIKGKHEYFAFPFDAISVNPNLKQNPSGE